MDYRMLGPLEVRADGRAVPLGGPRHRRLLSLLLLHAGEVVPTERIVDLLMGERSVTGSPEMVHVRVSELRGALRRAAPGRPGDLVTRRPGYLLEVEDDDVDARRFERLVASGRRSAADGDAESAARLLSEGLALWRGPVLPDIRTEPFAEAQVTRLEELRLQALQERVDADLACGRHQTLVPELTALIADHPLCERFRYQLMLALYRSGRRGEALLAFQAAREQLGEELGVEPGREMSELHVAMLRQDPGLHREPLQPTLRTAPSNLPQRLTTFVGRRRELAEIPALLSRSRLVTLTGGGGAGKSRLAVEAGASLVAEYPGGVWIVDLAALDDGSLVAAAVAGVLGVRERPGKEPLELLRQRLRPDLALLILDNCEHLVGAVTDVARGLVETCPRLHVLCTSRQRLGVPGEVLLTLGGLALPADPSAGSAATAEAVRLFVDRASAVQPSFRLTADVTSAVARICTRLDGLPLAIELAAARTAALDVPTIAARLEDRFCLLGGPGRLGKRHSTLEAAVDWSYRLLAEPERRLFTALSVFVGGFTLPAAQAVCGPDTTELLAGLVDKSLVTVEPADGGSYRYRLLETMRAYGGSRLRQHRDPCALRDRHAAVFLELAETAAPAPRGPGQPEWLDRLETEHGNLRAALAWSVDRGDAATAVRLTGALARFWDVRGHYREGCRWLSKALAMPGSVPSSAAARAWVGQARLAVIQGCLDEADAACRQALARCRDGSEDAVRAEALYYRGFVAVFRAELDEAERLLTEALAAARSADAAYAEGWSLLFLSVLALTRGQFGPAAAHAETCRDLLGPLDREGMAWALLCYGAASWAGGDGEGAVAPLRAGLSLFVELDGRWGLSLGLFLTAELAGSERQWHQAGVLLGAAEELRTSIGAALMPFVGTWMGRLMVDAELAGAAEILRDGRADGRTLPLSAAVAAAHGVLGATGGVRIGQSGPLARPSLLSSVTRAAWSSSARAT